MYQPNERADKCERGAADQHPRGGTKIIVREVAHNQSTQYGAGKFESNSYV